MKKPEIMVEFNLFGLSIDFDEITAQIGIIPTKTRKKEGYKIAEYAKDTWTVSTGYKEAFSISEPFEEIANVFFEKYEIINQLKDNFNIESNIVVVVKSDANMTPEFILTQKCIELSYSTNSEIHFDNYFFT